MSLEGLQQTALPLIDSTAVRKSSPSQISADLPAFVATSSCNSIVFRYQKSKKTAPVLK
jgi:hypothetical protein